jgi:hypothetical protein
VINVRSSYWRARIVTPGAFHAAYVAENITSTQ